MKRNAIARIILFSILILILSSILLVGLSVNVLSFIGFESDEDEITGEPVTYGSVEAFHVKEIDIDWVSGNIQIVSADVPQIRFSETGTQGKSPKMRWELENGTLKIEYKQAKNLIFGIGINYGKVEDRDLTVTVPKNWVNGNLSIETASADLTVNNVTLNEMEFDGASGICEFTSCTVSKLNVDTVSGNIDFSGYLEELEVDAVSADCNISANNVPRTVNVSGVSGDLKLTLPYECGFTARLDTVSGSFHSDFETTMRNDIYTHGDGACRIEVEGVSGDITIHQFDNDF